MLSFWERDTWFPATDLVVIGAGIVGLSTALHYARKRPHHKILVLERGPLPAGASTKNAGFACFGSLGELIEDEKQLGREALLSLVEMRWKGLHLLRETLGDQAIAYEGLGGYELFRPGEEATFEQCLAQLEHYNSALYDITGDKETYSVQDALIARFGFGHTTHLIRNRLEGQLHTGLMMRSLEQLVRQEGVSIVHGMEVERWEEGGGGEVSLYLKNYGTLTAHRLAITTNGFARELLPGLEVKPGRAQVLITKPLEKVPFEGAFHYHQGYYYFRNVGRRVLFGGGRNLDIAGETTTELALTPLIQQELEKILREVILPGQDFEIDLRWSGIMGLGPEKGPLIQRVRERVYCGVRMGGMGVAIGSLVGKELAALIRAY